MATFTEDAGDGFLYEIDHFCQLLRQGALESPLVPLDDTLACAKVFDEEGNLLGCYISKEDYYAERYENIFY